MKAIVHMRDIRLRNNAGLDYPVCKAEAHSLDMYETALPMTGDQSRVTCKHCIRAFAKRYPWAVRAAPVLL